MAPEAPGENRQGATLVKRINLRFPIGAFLMKRTSLVPSEIPFKVRKPDEVT